jgi:hypothetical protein
MDEIESLEKEKLTLDESIRENSLKLSEQSFTILSNNRLRQMEMLGLLDQYSCVNKELQFLQYNSQEVKEKKEVVSVRI